MVRHRVAAERVQVRHEMAAHAVCVDELQDACLLLHGLQAAAGGRERRRRVLLPAHRPVRHLEVREDALVEAVAPEEEVLQGANELARLGALDDAVAVSYTHLTLPTI